MRQSDAVVRGVQAKSPKVEGFISTKKVPAVDGSTF